MPAIYRWPGRRPGRRRAPRAALPASWSASSSWLRRAGGRTPSSRRRPVAGRVGDPGQPRGQTALLAPHELGVLHQPVPDRERGGPDAHFALAKTDRSEADGQRRRVPPQLRAVVELALAGHLRPQRTEISGDRLRGVALAQADTDIDLPPGRKLDKYRPRNQQNDKYGPHRSHAVLFS